MDISGLGIRGELLLDEPMSLHTSLKVGGPADLFARPADRDDLQQLLRWLQGRGIPWITVGKGYNLLVRDGGIRGAVISLERFNDIELAGEKLVRSGAGADNLDIVRFAQQHGLGGIAFIAGIPGTVGGAIRMNAGAYGEGILERTECITLLRGGEVREFCMDQLEFGYRHLDLQQEDVILAATFRLAAHAAEETEEAIRRDLDLRRTKHNVGYPSAGSFFKNPAGQAAWRLIDAAGMRGERVGGAQVSTVHSNFLVNAGGGTARDFFQLSARVKDAVLQASGVVLEEEVRIVGED
ncbi:MAG TPA: UDP-N-acetylmuramate dehydrogenase [Geobacteraceae bacterium]|nr:UDP-N-acetylmuramate dehydrogenase [Geobacteraceae bacterium]